MLWDSVRLMYERVEQCESCFEWILYLHYVYTILLPGHHQKHPSVKITSGLHVSNGKIQTGSFGSLHLLGFSRNWICPRHCNDLKYLWMRNPVLLTVILVPLHSALPLLPPTQPAAPTNPQADSLQYSDPKTLQHKQTEHAESPWILFHPLNNVSSPAHSIQLGPALLAPDSRRKNAHDMRWPIIVDCSGVIFQRQSLPSTGLPGPCSIQHESL